MSLNVRAVEFSGRQKKLLSVPCSQLVVSTENYKRLKYQYILPFGKCEKFTDKHFIEDL